MDKYLKIFNRVFDDVAWDEVNQRTQKDLLVLRTIYETQKNELMKIKKQKEILLNEVVKLCDAISEKLHKENQITKEYLERWLENEYIHNNDKKE